MAVLEILTLPDERLRQVSEPVTLFDADLRALIADLEDTRRAGPAAVGIAAPQVGRFQRIVIVDVSGRPKIPNHGYMVLVNPEITRWEGFELGREGCLSLPDYTGNVIRAERIELSAQDPDGRFHEYTMEGFEARAVQHEVDHLDGILYPMRMTDLRQLSFESELKHLMAVEEDEVQPE